MDGERRVAGKATATAPVVGSASFFIVLRWLRRAAVVARSAGALTHIPCSDGVQDVGQHLRGWNLVAASSVASAPLSKALTPTRDGEGPFCTTSTSLLSRQSTGLNQLPHTAAVDSHANAMESLCTLQQAHRRRHRQRVHRLLVATKVLSAADFFLLVAMQSQALEKPVMSNLFPFPKLQEETKRQAYYTTPGEATETHKPFIFHLR